MSWTRTLSLSALIAGASLLAYGALQGDVSIHLVLILPVITGTGPWAALGGLLLIAGLAGLLAGAALPPRTPGQAARSSPETPGPKTEATDKAGSGGILLLGPIPIVWGSNRDVLWKLALLGLAVTLPVSVLFYTL